MAMASVKRKEPELVYDHLSDFSLFSQIKKIKSLDGQQSLMREEEDANSSRNSEAQPREEQRFASYNLVGGPLSVLSSSLPNMSVRVASDANPDIKSDHVGWQENQILMTWPDETPMVHKSTATSSPVVFESLQASTSINGMQEIGMRDEFLEDAMEIEDERDSRIESVAIDDGPQQWQHEWMNQPLQANCTTTPLFWTGLF